jgi:hypothetical protein
MLLPTASKTELLVNNELEGCKRKYTWYIPEILSMHLPTGLKKITKRLREECKLLI